MKQKEFFGKGEKHVYVRKGDKGEILVTKTKHEELITEENTLMRKKPVNLGFSY